MTDARQTTTHPDPLTVKAHHEAGSYCCGFTFYESLANCYIKKRTANVLFCHVPGETDRESLERARDSVLAIIVSAVDDLVQDGVRSVDTAAMAELDEQVRQP